VLQELQELQELILAFQNLFVPNVFIYLLVGELMGIIFGIIPGLGAAIGLTLLLPFSYVMETSAAFAIIIGMYTGAVYGGCITAITINIPGTASSAITGLDGYALMKQGRGAEAIGHSSIASSFGGLMGAIVLILLSRPLSQLALSFRTPEKFLLILFSLIVVGTISTENLLKGLVSAIIGLMISTIGLDPLLLTVRISWGQAFLIRGVGLITCVVGLFAISEFLIQMESGAWVINIETTRKKMKMIDIIPKWNKIKKIGLITYFRSAIIGIIIGILPGCGTSMASYTSYFYAKNVSRQREKFGKGALEGVVASEVANNASCGGAFVPFLAFGIPGSGAVAIISAAFLIHNLIPGPELFIHETNIVMLLFASLIVSALLIPLFAIIIMPFYLRIITINRAVLLCTIITFSLLAVYCAEYSTTQMYLALILGVVAYFLKRNNYSLIPILMGYILGPYLEIYFRRSCQLGGLSVFLSPISLFLIITLLLFIVYIIKKDIKKDIKKVNDEKV